ncbi:hypothetical protein JL721_9023 [Aureococcus anophagefferens]|nr:hypothetical protein JL721_9023 [Aureococcus anophagefferens]
MTKSDRGSIIIKMEASPPAEATSRRPHRRRLQPRRHRLHQRPRPATSRRRRRPKAKAKDDGATTRKVRSAPHAPHAPPPEPPQCVGKWTIEETEFTTRIIELFNTGLLELPEGATLRSYLAQKLSCDPMRITKKFSGASCLGKRVFHSSTGRQRNSASAVAPSAASVAAAQQELSVLEARFVDACIRSTESKDARMIDLEARFLHSHDVVSTPAIDAFIMQSCQPLWDPDGVKSGGAPARAYAPAPTLEPLPPPDGRGAAAGAAAATPRCAAVVPPEPPSFRRPARPRPRRPGRRTTASTPGRRTPGARRQRPPARAPAPGAPPAMRAARARARRTPPATPPTPRARGPPAPQPTATRRKALRSRAMPAAAPQPRAAPPAPAARPAGDTVPANLLGFVQSLHRSDSHSELVDFVEDVRTKTDR